MAREEVRVVHGYYSSEDAYDGVIPVGAVVVESRSETAPIVGDPAVMGRFIHKTNAERARKRALTDSTTKAIGEISLRNETLAL